MNVSEMLNPSFADREAEHRQLSSPPLSPKSDTASDCSSMRLLPVNGKPRSRFSDLEDAVICEGVARGLTWGQISRQLPHRKRATCFNRYRTLQGIRKSRKRPSEEHLGVDSPRAYPPVTPPSPATLSPLPSMSSSPWLPTTPPSSSLPATADPTGFKGLLPSPNQILPEDHTPKGNLFPFDRSTADHRGAFRFPLSVRLAPLRSYGLSSNLS